MSNKPYHEECGNVKCKTCKTCKGAECEIDFCDDRWMCKNCFNKKQRDERAAKKEIKKLNGPKLKVKAQVVSDDELNDQSTKEIKKSKTIVAFEEDSNDQLNVKNKNYISNKSSGSKSKKSNDIDETPLSDDDPEDETYGLYVTKLGIKENLTQKDIKRHFTDLISYNLHFDRETASITQDLISTKKELTDLKNEYKKKLKPKEEVSIRKLNSEYDPEVPLSERFEGISLQKLGDEETLNNDELSAAMNYMYNKLIGNIKKSIDLRKTVAEDVVKIIKLESKNKELENKNKKLEDTVEDLTKKLEYIFKALKKHKISIDDDKEEN